MAGDIKEAGLEIQSVMDPEQCTEEIKQLRVKRLVNSLQGVIKYNIRRTALMQPSFSGLFVIWAYFPKTTLPPAVTRPSSETLTSITVPFVMTPSWVYIGDWGFFLTPSICNWKVAFRSAITEED
jgi:hypothetical protein